LDVFEDAIECNATAKETSFPFWRNPACLSLYLASTNKSLKY